MLHSFADVEGDGGRRALRRILNDDVMVRLTVARPSKGVYEITLTEELATLGAIQLTPVAQGGFLYVEANTKKRFKVITFSSTPALAEVSFNFVIKSTRAARPLCQSKSPADAQWHVSVGIGHRLSSRSIPSTAIVPAVDVKEAYLTLLKKSLCDLLAEETMTATPQPDGTIKAEPLGPADLERRETGAEWPLNATTMVGLRRLDDLQRCVETIVADSIEGDLIETGVWRGGASIFLRGVLAALGDETRDVWLADSFEGLPKANVDEFPADAGIDEHYVFDHLAVSEDRVRAAFDRYGLLDAHVHFLRGWFSDTLPPLRGTKRWSLLRLDGDMYESTMVALESLYPDLSPGGYVVIDDFGAIAQCRQAVGDFRQARGITDPIEEIDWTGARWRRSS